MTKVSSVIYLLLSMVLIPCVCGMCGGAEQAIPVLQTTTDIPSDAQAEILEYYAKRTGDVVAYRGDSRNHRLEIVGNGQITPREEQSGMTEKVCYYVHFEKEKDGGWHSLTMSGIAYKRGELWNWKNANNQDVWKFEGCSKPYVDNHNFSEGTEPLPAQQESVPTVTPVQEIAQATQPPPTSPTSTLIPDDTVAPSQQIAETTQSPASAAGSICNPEWKSQIPSEVNEAELKQIANDILISFFEGDESTFQQYLDGSQLISSIDYEAFGETTAPQVEDVDICGVLGNEKLVFLPAAVSVQTQNQVMQFNVLVILQNRNSGWYLVTIAENFDRIFDNLKGFYQMSAWFAGQLKTGSGVTAQPQPAILLAPEDGQYPQPSGGDRFGDFVWQPSPSTDILAEVIEFEYGFLSRIFFRLRSDQPAESDRISAGELFTNDSEWHWRVWSITEEGTVAFSEARSFVN